MKDSFILSPALCPCPAIFQSQHNTASAQLLHMDGALPSEERKAELVLRALTCSSGNYLTCDFPVLSYASQFSSLEEISPWIYTREKKNNPRSIVTFHMHH